MNFEHYILCRYNTNLFSDNVYKVKNPTKWMIDRKSLFKWLLISLEAQTSDNFTFIVYLDSNTPEPLVNDVESMLINNLSVKWEISFKHPIEDMRRRKKKSPWIITSRIDNDDYYSPDFVATIQDNFSNTTEVIDVYGIQYDKEGDSFYTSGRSKPNSPFVSLIEPSSVCNTVFIKTHTVMNQLYPARFVPDYYEPLYTQVIHGDNVSNKIIGDKIDK